VIVVSFVIENQMGSIGGVVDGGEGYVADCKVGRLKFWRFHGVRASAYSKSITKQSSTASLCHCPSTMANGVNRCGRGRGCRTRNG